LPSWCISHVVSHISPFSVIIYGTLEKKVFVANPNWLSMAHSYNIVKDHKQTIYIKQFIYIKWSVRNQSLTSKLTSKCCLGWLGEAKMKKIEKDYTIIAEIKAKTLNRTLLILLV